MTNWSSTPKTELITKPVHREEGMKRLLALSLVKTQCNENCSLESNGKYRPWPAISVSILEKKFQFWKNGEKKETEKVKEDGN